MNSRQAGRALPAGCDETRVLADKRQKSATKGGERVFFKHGDGGFSVKPKGGERVFFNTATAGLPSNR